MLTDDYSVRLLCDLLGCPRSSYYYQPKLQDETEVKSVSRAWLPNGPPTATAESPNNCSAKDGTSTRNEFIV